MNRCSINIYWNN